MWVDPLSKVAHQMWHDHPTHSAKETAQQWAWGLRVTGKWGGGKQNLKEEG